MNGKLIEETHDFRGGIQCKRCGVTLRDIAVQDNQPGCRGFVPACIPPLIGPASLGHKHELTLIDATFFSGGLHGTQG